MRVYQDRVLQNLTCRRIQVDEIWQFCYAKEKNVPQDRKGQFGYGDVWTWVALDADTKLVPCWVIGDRSADSASLLMRDLASRLRYRVQLTTDGHRAYLTAVEEAFGADINFSQLIRPPFTAYNDMTSREAEGSKYSLFETSRKMLHRA